MKMKRPIGALISLLAVSIPTAASAQFLQVENSQSGIQITNIFEKPVYVKDLILQEPDSQGRVYKFSVLGETLLQPGQSIVGYSSGIEMTSTTRLYQWNNGKTTYKDGVHVCYKNGFGEKVYTGSYGQEFCR